MRSVLQIIAIHEHVLAPRVTVQVAIQDQFAFPRKRSYCFFYVEDHRMNLLRWIFVTTIEILSAERAPVVTIDDAINVDHWHYFEYEVLTKSSGFRSSAYEEFDDSLHNPWRVALAGVNTSSDENTFFCKSLRAIRIFVLACYCNHVTPVASKCSAKDSSLKKVASWCVFFNSRQVILQVWESIGEAVSEELCVIVNIDSVHECKCVKPSLEFWISVFFEWVLIIVDVRAYSVPSNSLYILYFIWVTENFHSIVIEWIRLCKIYYVEPNFLTFGCVPDPEEKPLSVAICVDVVLQY